MHYEQKYQFFVTSAQYVHAYRQKHKHNKHTESRQKRENGECITVSVNVSRSRLKFSSFWRRAVKSVSELGRWSLEEAGPTFSFLVVCVYMNNDKLQTMPQIRQIGPQHVPCSQVLITSCHYYNNCTHFISDTAYTSDFDFSCNKVKYHCTVQDYTNVPHANNTIKLHNVSEELMYGPITIIDQG